MKKEYLYLIVGVIVLIIGTYYFKDYEPQSIGWLIGLKQIEYVSIKGGVQPFNNFRETSKMDNVQIHFSPIWDEEYTGSNSRLKFKTGTPIPYMEVRLFGTNSSFNNVQAGVWYETQGFGDNLNAGTIQNMMDTGAGYSSYVQFYSENDVDITWSIIYEPYEEPAQHKEYSFTPSDNTFSLNPGESKSTTITLEHLGEMIANENYELKFDITGSVII